MRVLHLLGATEDDGGILSVLRNLRSVEEPGQIHHEVLVHERYRESRQPALRYRRSRHLIAESPSHPRLLWSAARSLPELRRSLASQPADVLHAHSRGALFLAVLAARFCRYPVLFTNHAYARRLGLYRWAARQPRLRTSVLTPNMARHYGFAPGAVDIVSECCADSFFETPLQESRPADTAKLRVVGLGNIVRWKNWHLLLQAIANLTEAEQSRLAFSHYGPVPPGPDCASYHSHLQKLRNSLPDQVSFDFHGPSRVPVRDILANADWFVLPSTNEPCSVALIEALASGVPAIVSASGGNVDIVMENKTGLLFEAENTVALADCLRQALRTPREAMSRQAIRDSVRERSARRVASDYARIYRALLG